MPVVFKDMKLVKATKIMSVENRNGQTSKPWDLQHHTTEEKGKNQQRSLRRSQEDGRYTRRRQWPPGRQLMTLDQGSGSDNCVRCSRQVKEGED